MKKTLVAGLLITAVSTSCFSPVNTFAESKTTYSQLTSSTNQVAMNRLSDSIKTLGSQTPLIQGYGLIILKQPNLEVTAIPGITTDQGTARNHVQDWLDKYNPKLFNVNQDLQDFGTRFTNYYDILVELSGKVNDDSQAKDDFVSIFNALQDQMQAIQYDIKGTSVDLNNYKNDLVEDSKSFSSKVSRAMELYKSSGGDIEKFRTEIKQLDESIQDNFTKLLALPKENVKGSINIGKTVIDIWIDAGKDHTLDTSNLEVIYNQVGQLQNDEVTKLNNDVRQKQQQKILLLQKLSRIEVQATQMTLIDLQLNNFTRVVKKQIESFDKLVSGWDIFNGTMLQMKTSLNTDTKIDSNALQAQLKELKTFTDELNKQTTEYENSVTNIKVTEGK
ncbi:HBL/NHE enterotoxin family protein [Bacillus hominis]|uniref:HBL/NHE enterotoxin family protein n=2 Tax=Bacillus cereus group TaxID=86661 RepID=A0ABV3IFD6_9BACI|nr:MULTISPECIES: HBL/NHE enterotoxin family protein [Bacillus cereus group]PGV54714.1 hemolytic enterotoxin [Bacillus cereus]GLV67085.1 enterotoxin [Bacillus mycoides]MBJ8107551.1 HBL/NHE enterotoxin family protein [Bacillus cereus group sp. N8]MDM5436293.1 HBL/NHE enterotoxin family protein [Bacillus hominis]MDM5441751.1 HBL/NHE enterotoxin family protein [Bacillus hominis]